MDLTIIIMGLTISFLVIASVALWFDMRDYKFANRYLKQETDYYLKTVKELYEMLDRAEASTCKAHEGKHKAEESLKTVTAKFNEYMKIKDNRIKQLQDDVKRLKLRLDCDDSAVRMSGKIYKSYEGLVNYLDSNCIISMRDDKGRFAGRVTAGGVYDKRFKDQIFETEN